MKKSYLQFAMTLLLIPQILISQDSVDRNNTLPFEAGLATDVEIKKVSEIDPPIAFLQSFELVDASKSGLKVNAHFVKKVSFEVKIYNEKGLNFYQENFDTDDLSLSMGFANLPQGNYFISLKTDDGEIIRPIQD